MKRALIKKAPSKRKNDDMRAEYDFSTGTRGKHAALYAKGTNVVLLDPEVAKAFPDAKAVNDALRALLEIAARTNSRKRA
jgi:hypothetical protein